MTPLFESHTEVPQGTLLASAQQKRPLRVILKRGRAEGATPLCPLLLIPNFGGGGEIRTHGAFRHFGFQDRCTKPLCDASVFNTLLYFRPFFKLSTKYKNKPLWLILWIKLNFCFKNTLNILWCFLSNIENIKDI